MKRIKWHHALNYEGIHSYSYQLLQGLVIQILLGVSLIAV